MPARRRLIVVSNRGPVTFARSPDGARVTKRGAGGLATALRGLLDRHEVTWIASAIGAEDAAVARENPDGRAEHSTAGSPYRLRLLAHDPAAYDAYYNVIANPTLWFTQHCLWGLADAPSLGESFAAAWEGYASINAAFAEAVVAELDNSSGEAGGVPVFFHDYHLYLAPRLVRDLRPASVLAHFVHIPWPQADLWTVLPPAQRRAVHDGLLANDVVGVHTERWRRNLCASAEAILGASHDAAGRLVYRGRPTQVFAAPISVDPGEFDALADDSEVLAAERELEADRLEKLVVRVDRVDPSKNIVRGFAAFSLLLDRHPEWRGRVTMLALLDPSRQDISEYSDYRSAIETAAGDVNVRHGAPGYLPVELRIADEFARSVAAYKQYDVLFVNAVFDGLNLVAKEGPLVNRREGVVVLSENTGAHEELGEWTLTIDPFDVLDQADTLARALALPAGERAERAAAIAAHVRAHDLEHWLGVLLAQLDEATAYPVRVSELSHVDASGAVRMVDVGGKDEVPRRAVARGFVATSAAERLRQLPKGDALAAARLAGIMAAKRTPELIPLCHPLPISHIAVDVELVDGGVEIRAEVATHARTGVEMEALTAASIAALTIYDMAKAVDRSMTISIELLEKTKG